MIDIPEVTLIAVTSIEIDKTIERMKKSSEEINFGEIVFVSHEKPANLPSDFIFRKCEEIKDINVYNKIVFKDLWKYVFYSHCLLIHWDSCVINPSKWEDKWLEYDYIGAPWAIRDDAYIWHRTGEHIRVGNGGFSLRSKKLMNIPRMHDLPLLEEQGWYNEDGNICIYHRKRMLDLGVNYAPVEEAAKFSWEVPVKENFGIMPFGFHKNPPTYTIAGQ